MVLNPRNGIWGHLSTVSGALSRTALTHPHPGPLHPRAVLAMAAHASGRILLPYILAATLARSRQSPLVQIGQIVQIGHFSDHRSQLSNLSKMIKVNSRFPLQADTVCRRSRPCCKPGSPAYVGRSAASAGEGPTRRSHRVVGRDGWPSRPHSRRARHSFSEGGSQSDNRTPFNPVPPSADRERVKHVV
jgi:hypothetical protein